MTTPATADPSASLDLDPTMLDAILRGTREGLEMTQVAPLAVGASRFFAPRHPMSVIVGLVGSASGTLTLNMSEAAMMFLSGQLIGEPQTGITADVIDAMMEVGNLVAGCTKDILTPTEYQVKALSLPSVIFGQSYRVLYTQGLQTVSVEFEISEMPFETGGDRCFVAAVSLLRGTNVNV